MSARLSRSEAEDLIKALAGVGKARALYPPGHAAVERAQGALEKALAAARGPAPLLLGAADGYLVVGEVPFLEGPPQAEEVARWLAARGVEAAVLAPDAAAPDVARFVHWLRAPSGSPWRGRAVTVTRLAEKGSPWDRGLRAYRTALSALEEAYREAEEGRLVEPGRARACVRELSQLLSESPSVLQGLVLIKDYDRYTFHHSVNVCILALGLGRHLGLSASELEALGVGGLFHDIGKTRTPPEVVRKSGPLNAREWTLMWRHPEHGRDILREMGGVSSVTTQVVYEHHMRHDGGGYPERPAGYTPCPLTALVTVSDVYDAMTTHRPYSAPVPPPEAVELVRQMRGTHFDPRALDAFLAVMGRVPVGSMVRLRGGEAAVVQGPGSSEGALSVWVVSDAAGRELPPDGRIRREVAGTDAVHWVDPLARGIDPAEVVRPGG